MKRRRFCRYMALGSLGFAGVQSNHPVVAAAPKTTQTKSHHRWGVLYWMPYDNDLVGSGEPIINMLVRGTQNSDVLVVVQSDYLGDSTMRRRQILNGAIQELEVDGEDSSDPSALAAYLDWAHQTYEADHWAVMVVGHGGKINEISPDWHSRTDQPSSWMRVDQFIDAVSHFNQATDGRVELLYFQNCNKATLEVVYEARHCARYTLASQLELGAPNFYYEGFLNRLQDSSVGGYEAAIAIMDSERSDMFHTLTLIDNQAIEQLPEKLSAVIQPMLQSPLPMIDRSKLSIFTYQGEQHCDVLSLLGCLLEGNHQAQMASDEFADFLRSGAIAHYRTGGEFYAPLWREVDPRTWCGLSLYLPETEQEVSRYSSFSLSKSFDLADFYSRLLTA